MYAIYIYSIASIFFSFYVCLDLQTHKPPPSTCYLRPTHVIQTPYFHTSLRLIKVVSRKSRDICCKETPGKHVREGIICSSFYG